MKSTRRNYYPTHLIKPSSVAILKNLNIIGSILREVQEFNDQSVDEKSNLKSNSIAANKVQNFQCKLLYNTQGPIYSPTKSEIALVKIREIIERAIKHANDNKYASIAFTSMSTDNTHISKDEAAKIIFKTLEKYADTQKFMTIYVKIVKIVIRQKEIFEAFQLEF
eukprot:403344759